MISLDNLEDPTVHPQTKPEPLKVEEIDIEIVKKYIHPTYIDCDKSASTIDYTKGLEATFLGVMVYDEVTEKNIETFCNNINKLYSKGLIENSVLTMPLKMKLAKIGERERWMILFYPMTRYNLTYLKKVSNIFHREGDIPDAEGKIKPIK